MNQLKNTPKDIIYCFAFALLACFSVFIWLLLRIETYKPAQDCLYLCLASSLLLFLMLALLLCAAKVVCMAKDGVLPVILRKSGEVHKHRKKSMQKPGKDTVPIHGYRVKYK